MPDLGKLSQQGRGVHSHFMREAERQGVGEGLHCHASAWADAGRPAQWLILWPVSPDGRQRTQTATESQLRERDPLGRIHKTALLLDAVSGGAEIIKNPAFEDCVRRMSKGAKAALYCDQIAGGAGVDGWGVASHVYGGVDANGRELHIVAATGAGQCRDGRERYPATPTRCDRVGLTTGGGDAAMPYGQRRATLAETNGKTQDGYTVSDATPVDADEAPLNAKARRKAQRLADGITKTAAQQ